MFITDEKSKVRVYSNYINIFAMKLFCSLSIWVPSINTKENIHQKMKNMRGDTVLITKDKTLRQKKNKFLSENFRIVDIDTNAWSTLFIILKIKIIFSLRPEKCINLAYSVAYPAQTLELDIFSPGRLIWISTVEPFDFIFNPLLLDLTFSTVCNKDTDKMLYRLD